MAEDPCEPLQISDAPEKSYFIQMTSCAFRGTERKAVCRDLPKNYKFPDIVLDEIRKSDTRPTAKQLQLLLDQTIRDPWLVTGEAFTEPYWSVGMRYEQSWIRRGLRRGRLVATAPLGLNPASRKISVQTLETLKRRPSQNDPMELSRTTDILGDERISLAAQKQILREQSAEYNPNATVKSVSVPIKDIANVCVGGSLGISATFGELNRETIDQTIEYIEDTTLKAIESLRSARTLIVEEETTAGLQTTADDELSNPNRVNTLTYLYYELEEEYQVVVAPVSVDLYLHVPLPVNFSVTKQWLLAHECLLKPLIDCPSLISGFDAARRLDALDRLDVKEAAGRTVSDDEEAGDDSNRDDKALSTVISAVERLLHSYEKLSEARLDRASFGKWVYYRTLTQFSKFIDDACVGLRTTWDQLGRDERTRSAVVEAITTFERDIGNIETAFLRLNNAVSAMMLVGTTVAYGPFMPFIFLMAAIGENFGADLDPDDAGLERDAELMITEMDALLRAEALAAEPDVATPLLDPDGEADAAADAVAAALLERERVRQQRQAERAEAETRFLALRTHVEQRLLFFHQVIWSEADKSWIVEQLRRRHIPPELFEHRFTSFEGSFGALRLTNIAFAERLGFDRASLDAWRQELEDTRRELTKRYTAHAPAPGVVVEPLVGTCMGGDPFVVAHRAHDVERAGAEVRRLKAEAAIAEKEVERLEARLANGILSDPTPFENTGSLAVHTRVDHPDDE